MKRWNAINLELVTVKRGKEQTKPLRRRSDFSARSSNKLKRILLSQSQVWQFWIPNSHSLFGSCCLSHPHFEFSLSLPHHTPNNPLKTHSIHFLFKFPPSLCALSLSFSLLSVHALCNNSPSIERGEMSVSSSSRGRITTELQVSKKWTDRETSPERTKVWAEPKPKTARKVSVVYYLSRNGQLEHPHFMEVPLSSPQGLYLKDVINRLNVLRGKAMPAMYSWSSKRYRFRSFL